MFPGISSQWQTERDEIVKLSYLNLQTIDPTYNLAVEQYVFDSLPRDRSYLMLWQNDRAVIIGRYQNTLAEINEGYVRENGIQVVRRLSGGGAVYHDLGNLNYTFITDAGDLSQLDFQHFCQPVVRALMAQGVRAEITGRNDITIDGKKISGNSQYLRNGRIMHHGTLLFDSNLNVISEALCSDSEKIQSKGIKSIHSRVTNIRPYLTEDISLTEFREVLLNSILEYTPGHEYCLSTQETAEIEDLRRNRYATWEWNCGTSPPGTMHKKRRIDGCGRIDAYISIRDGLIESFDFQGDFFSAEDPELLSRRFLGIRPDYESYRKVLRETDITRYFFGITESEFLRLLCE